MHSYTIRAGLIRRGDAYRSMIAFPSRGGEITVSATVPRAAVLALREHLRAALRDPSRAYARSLDQAMRAQGDEIAGIWDTLRGLLRTGISALPIPGAGLLAQGVDALGNVIQRRVSRPTAPAPAPRPAPAPAPAPASLPAALPAPAAPAGLPGLAGLLAQLGLGGASPEQAMGGLSALAAALQGARAAAAMPPAAPAMPPFSLFGGGGGGGAPALPSFLRGLVGAADAEVGVQLFDLVGGGLDDLPPHWRAWVRAAPDPRVAEALAAARALHAWMHEHPLRRG